MKLVFDFLLFDVDPVEAGGRYGRQGFFFQAERDSWLVILTPDPSDDPRHLLKVDKCPPADRGARFASELLDAHARCRIRHGRFPRPRRRSRLEEDAIVALVKRALEETAGA